MKPDSYYAHSRPEMLKYFPAKPGLVLDVGCGDGRFGAVLKERLVDAVVWGVEPMAAACRSAEAVLDRVFHGAFDESLGLPIASFDTIVFNDSLEHFPDYMPPLKLARRLLKPGGVLIASIPNVRYWPHMRHYLFGADWQYCDEGILDRTHLRFFTRRSMGRVLVEAGFDVQRMEGINPCWVGLRLALSRTFLPSGMRDLLYLQFAVTALPMPAVPELQPVPAAAQESEPVISMPLT